MEKFGTKPIIHLYAICWNEEFMLPYFFRHYDQIVSAYFIYDNMSTDRSIKIIDSNPKAAYIPFKTNDQFDVAKHHEIINEAWKASKDVADWIIVCDIDEFLYWNHTCESLGALLYDLEDGLIPQTQGFEMYSEKLPTTRGQIYSEVTHGVPSRKYSKRLLFPATVEEINYVPGAHMCHPKGAELEWDVAWNFCPRVLHFKHLDYDYCMKRNVNYAKRLSPHSIKNNWCLEYLKPFPSKNIATGNPDKPIAPWWTSNKNPMRDHSVDIINTCV